MSLFVKPKLSKYHVVFLILVLFIAIPPPISLYNSLNNSYSFSERELESNSSMNATLKQKTCIILLCIESHLNKLKKNLLLFEQRFNSKYKYDYVILNNDEFSDKFKDTLRTLTKAEMKFGLIPKEHWSYPSFIDQEKAKNARLEMARTDARYALSESYRFMCRYYSGFFFRHPLVMEYDYYWRLDADSEYTCDINYDPIQFLVDNNYYYGFTITLYETKSTITTLWNETVKFMNENPSFIDPNSNNLKFITKNTTNEYNLCHYWSNFEIGSLKFFRSEKYLKYFEHLEKAGGFFYERWGDAPVHSIGLSLFLPKSKIYYFEDIGYYHYPYRSIPSNCNFTSGYEPKAAGCLTYWKNT